MPEDIVRELREAATSMREQHASSHPRHEMWFTLADLLEYTATDPMLKEGHPGTPTQKVIQVARVYNAISGQHPNPNASL